ncbi:MAG: hypothetical protein H8K08_14230 [Nitrospira sp.]|nr:hypothetical protein [Nitrospira sp.]
MRKNYRQKRRSCALCKPHKVGWASRWTAKEAALREAMELERQQVSPDDYSDQNNAWATLAETKRLPATPLDRIIKKNTGTQVS